MNLPACPHAPVGWEQSWPRGLGTRPFEGEPIFVLQQQWVLSHSIGCTQQFVLTPGNNFHLIQQAQVSFPQRPPSNPASLGFLPAQLCHCPRCIKSLMCNSLLLMVDARILHRFPLADNA